MVLALTITDHVWIVLTGLAIIAIFLSVVFYAMWLCEDWTPPSRFKTVMRWLTGAPLLVGVIGGMVWVLGAATLGYIQ